MEKEKEQYYGYCVDLANLLMDAYPSTKFKLHLVKDGKYGAKGWDNVTWNGMIGELIRGVSLSSCSLL